MPVAATATIHPTALVDPRAEIADGVSVGPQAVIEAAVRVGPGCVIRARAMLCGPLTLGSANDIGVGVVLGERAQHLGYINDETGRTEIGDNNIFREYVTVHRGTPLSGATVIGNNNFLMANAHVGHDCRVGNHVIFANGAMMGGHCEIFDRAFMSGSSGIHQFTRVGRLAFLSGFSCSTKDLLPFMMMAERDRYVGINRVGMQRAGIPPRDVLAVRKAYHILFRSNLLQKLAVERLEKELGQHAVIGEILEFIRSSKRGFIGGHRAGMQSESEAA